jgi:hypothetical protein
MKNENRPVSFIEALNKFDSTLYQSVHRIVHIGATLPVSVTSSERSFSSYHRLKSIYVTKQTKKDVMD